MPKNVKMTWNWITDKLESCDRKSLGCLEVTVGRNVNCYNPLDEMCAICIEIGNRLDPEVPTTGLLPVEIKAFLWK